MIPRLRIPPQATALMTRPFIAAVLLLGPVLGAEASIIMILGAFLGLFQYLNSNFPITESRPQRLIFKFILTWFATETSFGLLHFNGMPTVLEIAENLPFLGYIILVSGMEHSSKLDLRRVIHLVSPYAAFVALAVAIVQIQIGPRRAEGAAGNAGPFAALCLIVFGCCLLTAIETKGRSRLLGTAGAGAAAACVMLSGMRGLWPALAIVPAALAIVYWRAVKQDFKRVLIGAAITLLAVFFLSQATIEKRISLVVSDLEQTQTAGGRPSSLQQHLLIWRAGWSLLSEAPMSGHGLGRNRELMAARTSEIGGVRLHYSHFHNAILTQGVQSGIIGILALTAMFLAPLWLAARQPRDEFGKHGFSVILIAAVVYTISGVTGIMFGHDLMDMGWIAAMSYGSFQVFGQGAVHNPAGDHFGDQPAGPSAR